MGVQKGNSDKIQKTKRNEIKKGQSRDSSSLKESQGEVWLPRDRTLSLLTAGGLGGGCGLDPLQEGGGLAAVQEHLPGLVRHGARGGPVQRRRHGGVRLRDPALRLRGELGGAGRGGGAK